MKKTLVWGSLSVVFLVGAVSHAESSGGTSHLGGTPTTVGASPAAKAIPTPCSFDALTNECEYFNPEKVGREIKLPDGTYLTNYSFIEGTHDRPKDADPEEIEKKRKEGLRALNTELLNMRQELAVILLNLPKGTMSLKFTLFATNTDDHAHSPFHNIWERWIKGLEAEKGKEKLTEVEKKAIELARATDDETEINLPFPPNDEAAKIKGIKFKEVREWLEKNLGKKQADIAKLLKKNEATLKKLHEYDQTPGERKDKTIGKDREDRVKKLFSTAITSIDAVLLEKLSAKGITEPEKEALENARKKIKLVKLRDHQNPKVKEDKQCEGIVPGAWYDPTNLTVSLCSQFYNYPDASILAVLGHEIGHSIDPCNAQCPTCRVHKDKIDIIEEEKKDEKKEGELPKIPALPPFQEIMLGQFLRQIAEEEHTHFSTPMDLAFNQAAIEKYKKQGAFTSEIPGTKADQFAFKKIYDCLGSEAGGGFRKFSADEMKKVAKEIAKSNEENRVGAKDPKWRDTEEKRIYGMLTKYPECVGLSNHSQMGEAFADWMGAKVLGKYLTAESKAGRKLDTPTKKLGAIGFFASLICSAHFASKEAPIDELDDVLQAYARLGDPHPRSKKRLDEVILRNKEIRKALGCDPHKGECDE